MAKKSMIPGNTNNMLYKILCNYVSNINNLTTTAVFYDLSDKYQRERRLIKRDSEKLTFLDKVYKGIKKINTKLFERSRLLDKMERLELVERIFSEEVFKVNNFTWRVVIKSNDNYDSKEILSNALESYDDFMAAINLGIITILGNVKIHNEILYPTDYLNSILIERLKNHSVTFSTYNPDIGDLSDEAQSDIIEEYAYILAGQVPPNMFEEDLNVSANDDVEYFLYEYYLELRKIVLRLFNAYLYIEKMGKDPSKLERDDIIYLNLAFHYFTLSDEMEEVRIEDDFATEYALLPTFYKFYFNGLVKLMLVSVNEKDEFDELNEEKRKSNQTVITESNDNIDSEIIDFNDLTHKLLLQLKKHNNNQ
ncbi:MAG: hypothetical protein IKZ96_00700 [Bacilli bacterium]|nr:hypothetical protein [Bacilli bacterium]